jgi:hypothetical protein
MDRLPLNNINHILGAVLVVFAWQMELQQPVQSMPFNTNVVSSNLDQGEMYNIMW